MHVVFVNENTLGHASYARPYAAALAADPSLGITTEVVGAVPLPADLERFGNFYIRGLRRWNLDLGSARWRWAASWNARRQVDALRAEKRVDALVVNTQSVALALRDVAREIPMLVAADATFRQLGRTGWFGAGRISRVFHPLTLAPIMWAERAAYAGAQGILAWSEPVRQSLREEYGVAGDRIHIMPPSVDVPAEVPPQPRNARPRLLFIGGDFKRKGGPLLVEAYARSLAGRCDLHVVTQTDAPELPGVYVHRGVQWGSPRWRALWDSADVFVFPSTLETFGIVLVEALAFGVPVVASAAGAARDILEEGRAGTLVATHDAASYARAIADVLDRPEATAARVAAGRRRAAERYDIRRNTARLAALLQGVAGRCDTVPGPGAAAGA